MEVLISNCFSHINLYLRGFRLVALVLCVFLFFITGLVFDEFENDILFEGISSVVIVLFYGLFILDYIRYTFKSQLIPKQKIAISIIGSLALIILFLNTETYLLW